MKAKTSHNALSGVVSLGGSRAFSTSNNSDALVGITPVSLSPIEETVSISGSESLVRRAGEMYAQGNEEEARVAMREALKVAMQRLEANHGSRSDEPDRTRINLEVAWNSR